MSDRFVTVLYYVNGTVVNGPVGISYDRPAAGCVRVQLGVSYEMLEDALCRKLRIDRRSAKLKMTYRCPLLLSGSVVMHALLPLDDDESLENIFGIVSDLPPPMTMEVFIELIAHEQSDRDYQITQHDVVGPSTAPREDHANFSGQGHVGGCMDQDDSGNNDNTYKGDDCDASASEGDDDDGDNGYEGSTTLSHDALRENVSGVAIGGGAISSQPLEDINDNPSPLDDEHNVDSEFECMGEGEAYLQNVRPFVVPRAFSTLNPQALTVVPEISGMPYDTEWSESQELYKGLWFPNKDDLIDAVKRYCIARGQHIVVVKSDATRWTTKCKLFERGCPWRLRAIKRKKGDGFVIMNCHGPHNCLFPRVNQDHAQLDSKLIAREVHNVIERDPSISVDVLQQIVRDKFNYDVHYIKVWRAKQKAITKIFGDWDESYQMLPRWVAILQQENHGTQVDKDLFPCGGSSAYLHKFFWSFGPCIEGFKYCRPMIQIDGTHLYGKYQGKLLIATSVDANGHLFPLAFALIETENAENWGWFLKKLRELVTTRDGLCIVSDRHLGIIAAIRDRKNGWGEPRSYHRFCLRHVCSNFNKAFNNKPLKDLVYRAGAQHQPRKFESIVEHIKKVNKDAFTYLQGIEKEKWTMAYDGGHRWGWMTTNLAECMNGVLKGARCCPITACVQLTFYRCINFFAKRRNEIAEARGRGHEYTNYAIRKMRRWAVRAGAHTLTMVNMQQESFEVTTASHGHRGEKGRNRQIVHLRERYCSCGKWQCYGIPCSHVQAVCAYYHVDCASYIDDWYKLNTYARVYEAEFNPIPHEAYWPPSMEASIWLPSVPGRGVGRPTSRRIHNEMDATEPAKKTRCSLCKQEGHNKRRCPRRGTNRE